MEEEEENENTSDAMDKYSFHDGAFIKARILKEVWIRLFKDKQKCFSSLFLFPIN